MAEYIEREAVLQKKTMLTEYDEGGWGANVSVVRIEDINAIPAADVVPVVRCKDCKRGEVDDPEYDPDLYYCELGCGWNKGYFFCSYGEWRDTE